MSQLEGVKKELADLVQQRGVLEDRIRDLERKHAEANKALGLKREECEALVSRTTRASKGGEVISW